MDDRFNTDDLPYDLSSNELAFLIGKLFPSAVHGVDFWCAHRVKRNSAERISPAIIASWTVDGPEPSVAEIASLANNYATELTAFRKDEARKARLHKISARQLWLMAKEINITKASILASLDTLEDQDEADTLRIELTEPPLEGYERFSPAVETLREMQGIPVEQFDDLWAWASEIK